MWKWEMIIRLIVAKNIKTLLINKKSRVTLCAGSLELGDVDIWLGGFS